MKHITITLLITLAALFCVAGCSSLAPKAVGLASNGTVMKIETTGSTTSGSIAPNLLFGTVQNSLATAPALEDGKKTQVVVAYTEAQNSLAAVFGSKCVTRTFTYIGNPSESAEETKARLESVAKILTSNDVQAQTATAGDTATASDSATSVTSTTNTTTEVAK